jgi:hypothetical protein
MVSNPKSGASKQAKNLQLQQQHSVSAAATHVEPPSKDAEQVHTIRILTERYTVGVGQQLHSVVGSQSIATHPTPQYQPN